MTPLRIAALAALSLGVGACYSAAQPENTLPEPHYMSGPPGGGMDPTSANNAAQDGDDPADAESADDDSPPSAAAVAGAPAPAEAAPEAPVEALGDVDPDAGASDNLAAPGDGELAQGDIGAAPGNPTAPVTDDEIDATLGGYGQWVDTDDYGQVWRPDATGVGVDFTPYESGGSWEYTDAGWAFASSYPWGWLPFHYGRWAWFHDYWAWVPGYRWSPAWVQWRNGGGVVGWRPMRPRVVDHRRPQHDHRRGVGPTVRDHRPAELHASHWRFATERDFSRPHIRSHLYGNPAEGLRLTARVGAPALRARTPLPSGTIMRNRFTAARGAVPGANPQVRDHRFERFNQPGAPAYRAPTYRAPAAPPTGTFQPQPRAYQPPAGQPDRGFRPPAGQPDRGFRPPAGQPDRGFRPPAGQSDRGFRPPTGQPDRDFRPPAGQPPPRTFQPPPRTFQPPPRTFQPPPGQPPRTFQPPAAPPRAFRPPTGDSGGRAFRPPVAPPAVHTSPAPSHTSSPPPAAHGSSSSSSHSSGSSGSSSSHSSGGDRHR